MRRALRRAPIVAPRKATTIVILGGSVSAKTRAATFDRCQPSGFNERREENRMSLGTILLIILILLLIGAIPAWPYSRGWGYFPSGIVGVVVVVLLVMVLMGRL